MMNLHYNTSQHNYAGTYDVLYADTDYLEKAIKHDDNYERLKQHKEQFDPTDSVKTVFKDEFFVLNQKVFGRYEANL